MKTLLKNKKLLSGLVATMLGVAILVMSISLAWFTSEDKADAGPISLGSFGVKTLLEPIEDLGGKWGFPGSDVYYNQVGKVWKLGSIDGFVKVQLTIAGETDYVGPIYAQIKEDGVPGRAYPLGIWIEDPDYVEQNGAPKPGDKLVAYMWYIGQDGEYYVEIIGEPGDDELHFGYDIIFPTWMTLPNDPLTPDLKFKVFSNVYGVQWYPFQARLDYFGAPDMDFWDLLYDNVIYVDRSGKAINFTTGEDVTLVDDATPPVFTPFSVSTVTKASAIQRLIDILPDGHPAIAGLEKLI